MKKLIIIVLLISFSIPLLSQHPQEYRGWQRKVRELRGGGNLHFQLYDEIRAEYLCGYPIAANVVICYGQKITAINDSTSISEEMRSGTKIVIVKDTITVDEGISVKQMIDAYNSPGEICYEKSDRKEKEWNTGWLKLYHSKVITELHTAYIYNPGVKHVFWNKPMNNVVILASSFHDKPDWWLIIVVTLALALLSILELRLCTQDRFWRSVMGVTIIVLFIIILANQWQVFLTILSLYMLISLPKEIHESKETAKRKAERNQIICDEAAKKSVADIKYLLIKKSQKLTFWERPYDSLYHLSTRDIKRIIDRSKGDEEKG